MCFLCLGSLVTGRDAKDLGASRRKGLGFGARPDCLSLLPYYCLLLASTMHNAYIEQPSCMCDHAAPLLLPK